MYFKAKPENGIVSEDELIKYDENTDTYKVFNRERTIILYEGKEFHLAIRAYDRYRTEELVNLHRK